MSEIFLWILSSLLGGMLPERLSEWYVTISMLIAGTAFVFLAGVVVYSVLSGGTSIGAGIPLFFVFIGCTAVCVWLSRKGLRAIRARK